MSGAGSLLTYLVDAAIRDDVETLTGEVHTRPALLKTDGSSLTYAADVRVEGHDLPLRNVPIASGNRELIYASVGAAVSLKRNAGRRWEIVGFAKTKPGTRTRIGVDLATLDVGEAARVGVWSRLLTFGDLGDAEFGGGFGTVPLGSIAVFDGETLLEVRI